MNISLHPKKLYSIQIVMSQDRLRRKRQWLFHSEIDGEEKTYLNRLRMKSRLRIFQFKARLAAENRKSQGDQQNQLKPHLQEYRRQNTPKSAMLEKMQALSSKIRTSFKLNLAKIGINNYKAKYQKFMSLQSQRCKEEAYLQILDAMIGDQITDSNIISKKLEDLKKGRYNQQVITILPTYKTKILTEYPDSPPPLKSITRQVKQIYHILYTIYSEKIKSIYSSIDVQKQALLNVEEQGIIFIDQIDKLAVSEGPFMTGKGVSTEGVQRDLLPLIQGTVVNTKYGDVKTDHILFIASGSFSMAKVEDLIPQLLGRLPIRVSLNPINLIQMQRILRQPQFNLLFQYQKLLQAEGVHLTFTDEAIKQMAFFAYEMNLNNQNLGARRLHSIVEKVLQQISFNASDLKEQTSKKIIVDKTFVKERLKDFFHKINIRKFLI